MVEEGASGGLDEVFIEGRDLINQKNLLKYIRSNFEGLSLRNIESLQEIILKRQEENLEILEDNSYLGNLVKM